MSIILNIDTATENAQVSIAKDGIILQHLDNDHQKNHAQFLQPALQKILLSTGILINDVDAIAVTAGPGSYTGIRVGMASAKGLCYALNKPLITINTLEVLTIAAQANTTTASLFCPMIDARRMEVFTALYTTSLTPLLAPCALILNENSFATYLQTTPVSFFGSGAFKWQALCQHTNASFITTLNTPVAMANLAAKYFTKSQFAPLAYSQPIYCKEFMDNV